MSFLRCIFLLAASCGFSRFAGALPNVRLSQVPSLHLLFEVGMSCLKFIFFVLFPDLLVLSPILAYPRFPAYIIYLFKVGMSFLKFIFFLAVVSLDLGALPNFGTAYGFSLQQVCPS